MIRGGRDGVTWTMRPSDAHDLGRYLVDIGTRENDACAKDGAELQRQAHIAWGHECRDPGDCRVEEAA